MDTENCTPSQACGDVNVIVLHHELEEMHYVDSDGEEDYRNIRRKRSRRNRSIDYWELDLARSDFNHSRSPSVRDNRLCECSHSRNPSVRLSNETSLSRNSSHSRSPSVRDNKMLLSSSLDEKLRRQNSVRSSRKSFSASVRRQSRSSQSNKKRTISVEITTETNKEEKNRRRMVYIIIGIFSMLSFLSVLAVVVTLTHRTEVFVQNKTTLIYTFAKPSNFINENAVTSLTATVRKENEELNALLRDIPLPQNNSPPHVPKL